MTLSSVIRTAWRARRALYAVVLMPLLWTGAAAQTSTASLRGFVRSANGAPVADAQIQVTNPASGIRRGALTTESGFYNVASLQPGTYTVRVMRIGFAPQERSLRLQVGEVITQDFTLQEAAAQLEAVTVVAAPAVDIRSQEVATNITPEQIENLPQGNRNFLDFATLAPGVTQRGAGVSSGGAGASNSNLFVDGASYKSDVLPGGVAGQDPSLARNVAGVGRVLGNPFPQNAVQEFRVVSQNYKAEYQKASGAVITAATKSGTNEFHGDLFFQGQNESFIARNYFLLTNPGALSREEGVPNYRRSQFGGSLGGPIIRDKAHFFLSYEGNYQNTDTRVFFERPQPSVLAELPADALSGEGVYLQPLRSNLFFGKATYQVNDRQSLMFTANIRRESDERDFGGSSAVEQRNAIDNNVSNFLLRHTFAGQPFTNEASVSYQRFNWKQVPENPGLPKQVFTNLGVRDIVRGGNVSFQDFIQDRLSLRNDLTWTAGTHTVKGGVNVDFLRYDVTKRLDENASFVYRYESTIPNSLATPIEAALQIGNPDLVTNNRQVGAFLQDDWAVNDRLTLNLGVRWDYEHDWLNNDYVTPQWVQDSVRQFVSAHPYFNADDYITNGSDRPRFYGAFQPRLGFSYDVSGTNRTVIFGGGGLFYDRINYNVLLDEKYKSQRPRYLFRFARPGATPAPNEIAWDDSYLEPGALQELVASGEAGKPEAFLIRNDQKPPYTVQYSLGARQAIGDYTLSVTGSLVNGYNYFKWIWGHRDPQTGDLLWGSNGMGAILISSNAGRSWYRGLLFQLSKPFEGDARWGGDLSYTLSKTEVNTYQDHDDAFALDYWPENQRLGFSRVPGRFDERHRVVLNLATRLPLGFRASTITTLGSGFPYTLTTGCQGPWDFDDPNSYCNQQGYERPPTFIPDFMATPPGLNTRSERPDAKWFGPFGKWAYRNMDLRLQKDVTFGRQSVALSLDVLNVFNFQNFNTENFVYNLRGADEAAANGNPVPPRFPTHEYATFDSRRLQLGAKYSF